MRIVFLKKSYSPIGGSEVLTHELATRLAARGHEVRVVCQWPVGERYGFPPPHSLLETDLDFRRYLYEGVSISSSLRPGLGELGQRLDVLSPFNLLRYDLARQLSHGADIIHNICREYAPQAVRLARDLGARLVMTPLAHPGQFLAGDTGLDMGHYRRADALVALTAAERGWYAKQGVDAEKVSVIGLGPNLSCPGDAKWFRRRFRIPTGPIVLYVGRKERYKGVNVLAQAAPLVWRQFPEARFVFIGEASLFDLFTSPFRGRIEPRLINLPPVDEATKAAAYAACDVFCMPSRYETFGLVYAEAWLCGKPVVGGDIPALRDVIEHGEDGFLVGQRPDEVAGALIHLLADPSLRARLGAAGQRKVECIYNWDAVVEQTESLYSRLVAQPSAG